MYIQVFTRLAFNALFICAKVWVHSLAPGADSRGLVGGFTEGFHSK